MNKLYYALIGSIVLNCILLWIIFKPSPPAVDTGSIVAQNRKEVNGLKERIITLDDSIRTLKTEREEMNERLSRVRINLKTENEAIYSIPDSNLNDTVRVILRGV